MTDETPRRYTIAEAKLERIASDASYAKMARGDGPALSRFTCNHSMSVIVDSKGKQDLLFDGRADRVRGDAARLIQHWSPAMAEEFVRGYRLARAAGLLGDGKCNEAAALFMSRKMCHDNFEPLTLDERIVDGKEQMAHLVSVLHAENRKPGGIKTS